MLEDVSWIDEIGKPINITRAYTNPMNGEQSLAFCNKITLYDPESDTLQAAVLLRVVPISALEQKWVFLQSELENAELAMIDAGGYDNFEALETEFDRFNEYYPNVELVYTKVDDYNNVIGTVLEGNDAPDLYVNYSWMYGREQYKASIDHAENLADSKLGLNLECIRSNILLKTDDGTLPMVPVFSNTYGMLINKSLFEKEEISVPGDYADLVKVCESFRAKGYQNPLMGFSQKETTSLFTLAIYPFFCESVANDKEAFIANPFDYAFVPLPLSEEGAVFLDLSNLQFSVNKDSSEKDMANEFMRFLISTKELNEMAKNKGLMSSTKDLSFNSMYAEFGEAPESRILSPEEIGITDDAVIQMRQAVYRVGRGEMSIDEAVAGYGSFTQ